MALIQACHFHSLVTTYHDSPFKKSHHQFYAQTLHSFLEHGFDISVLTFPEQTNMTSFNNNNLHRSGWHVLASRWQDYTEELPNPPCGDHRFDHARVVWTDVQNMVTSIALIGGWKETQGHHKITSSVLTLRNAFSVLADNRWQNGPNLNVPRRLMSTSVCNGYVYVLGGGDRMCLDSIERIPVAHLFKDHQNDSTSSWTMLSISLSAPRLECAAVAVQNRFIVVVGGRTRDYYLLSCVDIIDTMTPAATTCSNNRLSNEDRHTVVTVSEGPNLQVHRCDFGIAVVNDQIWVVGGFGHRHSRLVTSIEFLEYGSLESSNESTQSIFSSSWKVRPNLALHPKQFMHGTAAMGQCLVAAERWVVCFEGSDYVELWDTQSCVASKLPNFARRVRLEGCTIVEMPHQGLAVLGNDPSYNGRESRQYLPCVNLSLMQLKKYLEVLDLRQSFFISHNSQEQQETTSEALLQRYQVESLLHSLLYFYLFYKRGHARCLQQQEPEQ